MSIKNYRRENDIKFDLSRKAAKIMVIAMNLQQKRIDLDIEINYGAIILKEMYFVDSRNLYQVYGLSVDQRQTRYTALLSGCGC